MKINGFETAGKTPGELLAASREFLDQSRRLMTAAGRLSLLAKEALGSGEDE